MHSHAVAIVAAAEVNGLRSVAVEGGIQRAVAVEAQHHKVPASGGAIIAVTGDDDLVPLQRHPLDLCIIPNVDELPAASAKSGVQRAIAVEPRSGNVRDGI